MINDGLIYALGSLVTTQAQRLFALSISPDHAFPFSYILICFRP